jgi:hypothetical protein
MTLMCVAVCGSSDDDHASIVQSSCISILDLTQYFKMENNNNYTFIDTHSLASVVQIYVIVKP